MDVLIIVGKCVAGLGGLGGIAAVVVWIARWLATRWAQRLHLAWQHEYDTQLEELRAEMSAREAALGAALSSGAAAHLAAQGRRMEALQELWQSVVDLRERCATALLPYMLFLPEEYATALHDSRFIRMIEGLKEQDVLDIGTDVAASVERLRPFLGQRLWMFFWIYRAFAGRLAWKLVKGREHGRILAWDENLQGKRDHLPALLSLALSDDEISRVSDAPLRAPGLAMDFLEQKMLEEADHLISGRLASRVTAEEWQRLRELLPRDGVAGPGS